MSSETMLVKLYESFNTRDIDAALTAMHPSIVWANGLDGGYVYGHAGVRSYWVRQWAIVDSRAEPLEISIGETGRARVDVHVTARTLSGDVLFDTRAVHLFEIEDGLIHRFNIQMNSGNDT
jgi:hypothetical protein